MNEVLPLRRPEAAVGGALHKVLGEKKWSPANEQPWHQHAARYCAVGMTQQQVAEACGVHIDSVKAVQRSPWFQELVCSIMVEQDRDVMEMARRASVGAMMKIVELSQNAKSEAIALAASESILDRHLGKAPAKIESDVTVRSADPVVEREQLIAEIRALEGQR